MADKTIYHPKYHFKKWDKDRQLTATSRFEGYHGSHHVDTTAPLPDPVFQHLTKLRS